MQQALSEAAKERARSIIASTFSNPGTLEELGGYRLQLEKQLTTVEAQLNGAVQSKLDSLKRAVDLMDESVNKLEGISNNVQRIDEKIALTNTTISNYTKLKNVNNAKENLTKVIDQVDLFVRVPDTVQSLVKRLESDPLSLKEVYLETVKLEALRLALLKEIRVSRNRRSSVGGGPTTTHNNSIGGDYSEELSAKVSRAIDVHLGIVTQLMQHVRDLVFDHISRMFELADDKPDLLVMSFEIVEMQQEYNTRRNEAALRRIAAASAGGGATPSGSKSKKPFANNNNNTNNNPSNTLSNAEDINSMAMANYENIVAEVQGQMRKLFDRMIQQEFTALPDLLEAHDNSFSTAIRMIGTQALGKIKYFQTSIMPCIPPTYESMDILLEAFEFLLLPQLTKILSEMNNLKVSEILGMLAWLEYVISSIHELDNNMQIRESLSEYSNMRNDLMVEYKERIKTQVHEWFNNIQESENEITKATDNTLVTSHPEDMFNIIHAQLAVAREKLPPEYVKEVAIACLQVLQDVQRQSYDRLLSNYQAMEIEYLCSIINDNQRMEEKCHEFAEEIIKLLSSSHSNAYAEDQEILEAISNEVAMEYLLIANVAVTALARAIMNVLYEPIFSKLYTNEWEDSVSPIPTPTITTNNTTNNTNNSTNNSNTNANTNAIHHTHTIIINNPNNNNNDNLLSILTVTLTDYFTDLQDWLSYYHYTKLVKEILVLTVGHYIMSLRSKANGIYTFLNELKIANKIIKDHNTLETYFEQYSEVLQRGGLHVNKTICYYDNMENALIEALEPLLCIARILSSRTMSGVENDIKELFLRYGIDGMKVIQSCFLVNPCLNKQERWNLYEQINKYFDELNVKKNMNYVTKASEDYVVYDLSNALDKSLVLSQKEANHAQNQKRGIGGFWGRLKG